MARVGATLLVAAALCVVAFLGPVEAFKGKWHTERTRNPGFKDAGFEVPSEGCK